MGDGASRAHVRDALIQEPALEACTIQIRDKDQPETVRESTREPYSVIEISVEDGVVTLNGQVPSLSNQRLAGVLAWWVPQRTILLTRAGSHAYGLATPESDLDLRGIVIPPKEYFLGFWHRFAQAESTGPDLVIYDIRKFFHLAAACNLSIIELLWTAAEDHSDLCGEEDLPTRGTPGGHGWECACARPQRYAPIHGEGPRQKRARSSVRLSCSGMRTTSAGATLRTGSQETA